MAVDTANAKVVSVLTFNAPAELQARFAQLGARFRGVDPLTGRQLYKTAAGVVLRLAGPTAAEVLSNCAC
jgi:hypothetical protein